MKTNSNLLFGGRCLRHESTDGRIAHAAGGCGDGGEENGPARRNKAKKAELDRLETERYGNNALLRELPAHVRQHKAAIHTKTTALWHAKLNFRREHMQTHANARLRNNGKCAQDANKESQLRLAESNRVFKIQHQALVLAGLGKIAVV